MLKTHPKNLSNHSLFFSLFQNFKLLKYPVLDLTTYLLNKYIAARKMGIRIHRSNLVSYWAPSSKAAEILGGSKTTRYDNGIDIFNI